MQDKTSESLFPTPVVLAVRSWGMRDSTSRISRKKTYTYRLTYLTEGEIEFICGASSFPCRAGDIFFMPPGTLYSTHFHGDIFQLTHIFFDLAPGRSDEEIARFPPSGVYSQYEQNLAVGHLLSPELAGSFSLPCRFRASEECGEQSVGQADTQFAPQIHRIHREFSEHRPYSRVRTGALLTLLMTDLARNALSPENISAVPPARAELSLAERAISYIDLHLTHPLTCASVAAALNYHPNYLNAIIRTETGLSLHAYIRQVKLRYADFLLGETDMSITEIAHMLSFCDSSHFARAYTAEYGLSPSARRTLDRQGIV